MQEAIELHLQGLKEDNLPIPDSSSFAEIVEVAS
jgi:predicted RNase H-like HicB family nuclease